MVVSPAVQEWNRNNSFWRTVVIVKMKKYLSSETTAAALWQWQRTLHQSVLPVGLELDAEDLPLQMSSNDWPELKRIFTERFASKTQAEWSKIFDGTDACVTPMLTFDEVSSHPHNKERASFIKDSGGQESPQPAPVLSRTPAEPCLASNPATGEHTVEVLSEYGFTSADIDKMLATGVVEGNAAKAKL